MCARFSRWIIFTILLVGTSGEALAQAILEPPLGLRWGESPEKLIVWATTHSLDVTISLPGDQPAMRILRVTPKAGFLPEIQAAGVEGRFLKGRLYEVTIHHFDKDASADLMQARFHDSRKKITLEHGTLLANQQQKSVEDQFMTRTQSFHREPVRGIFLLLAFTEVEDLLRKSREAKFSIVYQNDNLRKELLKP